MPSFPRNPPCPYHPYSRHLHRLPRVEDAAVRDPKRPGTLERTLDCVSADTPQVLCRVASEHEKLEAELAALKLERATQNRKHREQKRLNKLAAKNNGCALKVVGEAIGVLSEVLPTLRTLPKFRADDTLTMYAFMCLHEGLATALWLTTHRRVDEGNYTHPVRECGISAGIDVVADTANRVIRVAQRLEAMNKETASVDEEDSLPGLLHALSDLLEKAHLITQRRLQETKDELQRRVTYRTASAPSASAAVSRSINRTGSVHRPRSARLCPGTEVAIRTPRAPSAQ